MPSLAEKAETFAGLHRRGGAFIIPNPWDIGTARVLAQLGFEALATTSAGYAFSIGKQDGAVGREAMMAHVQEIVGASELPVSADLENGFGDAPETVAETVRLAGAAGLAGCSIEDSFFHGPEGIYDFALAVERIQAAVEAARALPFAFTLTARSENLLVGRPDLDDTIKRLQAFEEAGADVLYAPGLASADEIASVVKSLGRPLNVLAGVQGMTLDAGGLAALGVKRISVGSLLSRAAWGGFLRGSREMIEKGTFGFAGDASAFPEITGMMKE
ncbi:MAG: isocitrate lyase/PEP mutase family protein [Alphaproteobacteria bacterium]